MTPHELCDASVDYVLKHVNTIQYLIQSIEKVSGVPFLRDRIKCVSSSSSPNTAPRSTEVRAGYMWRTVGASDRRYRKGDVVLLEDHLAPFCEKLGGLSGVSAMEERLEQKDMRGALHIVEKDLRHELIHAFDDTRGVVEPSDCLHQACSEIRAARLSGDCFVGEEVKRWRWNVLGGKDCVRRRAVMAVETNPICRGFSERAVEMMFPRCYYDYEPFAAPIYAMGSYGDQVYPNGTLSSS